MHVTFYFERSCPEQRPRAALKPQEPRSSGLWTPGAPAPAEVLASRGVVVVESWQVASCRSYLCSREGGPRSATHTSPTPPWDLLAITPTPGTGPKTSPICFLCRRPAQNGCCTAGPENLVADEELRWRESRAKPELTHAHTHTRPHAHIHTCTHAQTCALPTHACANAHAHPARANTHKTKQASS
jgi:hypothetical protein